MKYMVVAERYKDKLEQQVSIRIEKGWIPQGGICIGRGELFNPCVSSTETYWTQAMIKHDQKGANNVTMDTHHSHTIS